MQDLSRNERGSRGKLPHEAACVVLNCCGVATVGHQCADEWVGLHIEEVIDPARMGFEGLR
jgi:hypothetical protein